MRVFPISERDFYEVNKKTTFAEARQGKYNSKVAESSAFDAQVDSVELAWEDFSTNPKDSVFRADLDYFTDAEKVALLRRYYNPVKYRGTIFPATGERPYTLDSIKCKKEKNLLVVESAAGTTYDRKDDGYVTLPYGAKYQARKARPFNLNSALLKHVSRGDNLGIYFHQPECKMIAFDLDSETGELDQSVERSMVGMVLAVHSFGLIPFVYASGGKGVHIEVFFDEHISVNKLNTLNQIILNEYIRIGGRHIDCVYPSGKAYRIFGCYHYKTGYFTRAIKANVQITVNPDTNKKRSNVKWEFLDPAESWDMFSKTSFNDSALVDKIIADNPELAKHNPKSKKGKATTDHAPKTHYYDIDILKRIHESGLFAPYTRYNISFQLGRYFQHRLKLTEDEAKQEIHIWLKRHYPDQCPSGLTPFEGAYTGAIKSPYALCETETLINCLNGYRSGQPFKRERVEINYHHASEYLHGLKYPRKKEAALLTLLSYAHKFDSLVMGFSYEQFLNLFHVKSKSTVSAWLREFMSDLVFACIRKGDYKTRKTSQYRLMLPEYCYRVIDYHDATE